MLEDAAKKGFEDIVSWQPGDNSFKVLKPKLFAATIMRRHFKQTQYKSFQRQLNIYGFQRVHYGPNMGGYMHSCFIKGHPELFPLVTRLTGPRSDSPTPTIYTSPLLVPNLPPSSKEALKIDSSELKPLLGAEDVKVDDVQSKPLYRDNRSKVTESKENLLADVFGQNDTEEKLLGREFVFEEVKDIGEERFQDGTTMQNGRTESTSMDDISSLIGEHTTMDDIFSLNCENDEIEEQQKHSKHAFPLKLHRMLDDADRNGFAHIVSWVEEGAAFKVHDSEEFLDKVMPNYFDQSKYDCFRRQLNLYDFNRVSKGPNRGGTYYHMFFLRSDRCLCQNINCPTSTSTSKTLETRVRSRDVGTDRDSA
jgi:hypothetical protein